MTCEECETHLTDSKINCCLGHWNGVRTLNRTFGGEGGKINTISSPGQTEQLGGDPAAASQHPQSRHPYASRVCHSEQFQHKLETRKEPNFPKPLDQRPRKPSDGVIQSRDRVFSPEKRFSTSLGKIKSGGKCRHAPSHTCHAQA